MVNELYAYFLKVAPTIFFRVKVSVHMYHCASSFLQKMYKTKVKTIFGDCPVVEQALVRVWLLATLDKMQFD